MHIITSVAALDAVTDEALRPILEQYRELMDLAVIFIVQPGDTLDTLQQARGGTLAGYELLENIGDHIVVTYILSDYGEGQILIVADHPDTDHHLLSYLRDLKQ